MKTILVQIFYLLVVIFLAACDTDSNVKPRDNDYFVKYYGESGDQFGEKVIALDNGFIMVGTSQAKGSNSDVLVVRTDLQGNEVWSNTYERNANDIGSSIVLSTSGFIVVANSQNDEGNTDILVLSISDTGDELNRTIIGDPEFDEEVADVIITQAGNILIAGSSSNTSLLVKGDANPNPDTYDFFFPQLNMDLTAVNGRIDRYGFSGEDKLTGVSQNSKGNFVFLGTTDKVQPAGSEKALNNMIMFQTTEQGLPNIAPETYGTAEHEVASHLAITSDAGFLFVGSSTDDDNSSNIFLTRVRQDNSLLGNYELISDANIKGRSIVQAQGGGFIIMGNIETNTGTNIYMGRTSNNGALNWERFFGTSGVNTAGEIIQLDDESYVFTGSIYLDNQSKMCLIKTNKNGDLEPL